LIAVYRPAKRSAGVVTVASVWGIVAVVALLTAIGSLAQERGLLQNAPAQNDPQILRSLARILDIESFDEPVEAPPPPPWLAPSLVLMSAGAGMTAWLCWARRPPPLYAGLAAAGLFLAGGLVVGVTLKGGALGLAAVGAGVLMAAVVALLHLAAASEFLGERRPLDLRILATSAPGLYTEGRAHYAEGLVFQAARTWVRAVGRDPSNPTYLHVLGLALARLGKRDQALAALERAAAFAPGDPAIQKSLEAVRAAAG
jgi:tetratricopeptide (TPR) repeat protein